MVVVLATPLFLVPPPPRPCWLMMSRGGGGGDGPEQHPHGAEMPMVEIRQRVDFPRGESRGGDDNNVTAAAASANADAGDSGD